jgi:hypothetical protein
MRNLSIFRVPSHQEMGVEQEAVYVRVLSTTHGSLPATPGTRGGFVD